MKTKKLVICTLSIAVMLVSILAMVTPVSAVTRYLSNGYQLKVNSPYQNQTDYQLQVKDLKRDLNFLCGSNLNTASGTYDTATKNEVLKFQTDMINASVSELVPDGTVGSNTRKLLDEAYAAYTSYLPLYKGRSYGYGNRSVIVKLFQRSLEYLGAPLNVNGKFDEMTDYALFDFQYYALTRFGYSGNEASYGRYGLNTQRMFTGVIKNASQTSYFRTLFDLYY